MNGDNYDVEGGSIFDDMDRPYYSFLCKYCGGDADECDCEPYDIGGEGGYD